MRTLCAGLVVAALVLALSVSAFAATQTISGQLIDQSCYKNEQARTPALTTKCPVATLKTVRSLARGWADQWRC